MSGARDELLPEGEEFEIKSVYTKGLQDRGTLVKTVVAMANTRGGRIVLERVTVPHSELDSARLDDLVNKYVGPRVQGIVSQSADGEAIEIVVPESSAKPHVFRCDLQFQEKGRTRTAFAPGQIWVRHSSKNEPASPEDVERMVRERAGQLLGELSIRVTDPDFSLARSDSDSALPVRVSGDDGAVAVRMDLDRDYPYTTKSLGESLGRNQHFASGAVKALRLRADPKFYYQVKTGTGGVLANRYSELAREAIEAELANNPSWNPHAAS